jgi:L-aminopeptidase/D-esterase-like protein
MAAPGPRNLITDVAGLAVGCAHDARVATGVTVVRPSARVVAGVDVRGGGPGARETEALAPENLVASVDAIVLAGGSVYGLAAADAVTTVLGAAGQGFALRPGTGAPVSPVVPAAILFDLANGGDKAWGEDPPYNRLGRTALAAVGEDFSMGRAGAGYGARAGATVGGLGSASAVTTDGLTVGALVAVNAFGAVRIPGSNAFWAWPHEQTWNGAPEFGGARPDAAALVAVRDLEDWGAAKLDPRALAEAARAHTTIAVVATDAALTPAQAKRLAVMAQTGIARAVRPAHAPFDGDIVFALSTAARPLPEPAAVSVARLGALAADCLSRAIARGVWLAEQGG